MIKPPKTAMLAALVVAGVGCKSNNAGSFPPGTIGKRAAEPAPVDPDDHLVGDVAEERIEVDPVGLEVDEILPDEPEPVGADVTDEKPPARPVPSPRIGKVAKPKPSPERIPEPLPPPGTDPLQK